MVVTKQEFGKIAMAIRTYYPKERILPDDYAIGLWYDALKDLPYESASLAVRKWSETNKWSPTIADIRSACVTIQNGEYAPWPTEWEKVLYAVRSKYGRYKEEEALNSFTEITRRCVMALGWEHLCDSENIMADRAHFGRIYEELTERKMIHSQMSEPVRNIIEGATSRREQLEIKMNQMQALTKKEEPEEEPAQISEAIQNKLDELRMQLGGRYGNDS